MTSVVSLQEPLAEVQPSESKLDLFILGEIPWEMLHELVQGQSLRKLHLGGNKFTVTTIPPIVSTMSNLVELSLYGLGYTGE